MLTRDIEKSNTKIILKLSNKNVIFLVHLIKISNY